MSTCELKLSEFPFLSGCSNTQFIIPVLNYASGYYENYNIDFADFVCSFATASPDHYISAGTYSGGYIYFSGHGINFSVDVNALLDDTNTYVTGGTLSGDTLILSRNDGVNISVDLSQFNYDDEILYLDGKIDSHTGNTNNPHQTSFYNLTQTAHTHTISEITDYVPGGSSFTGNTSATCINELYVSNVYSCSPLNIYGDTIINNDLTVNNNLNVAGVINGVKTYKALLTQTAPDPAVAAGPLIVGERYTITYVAGDDFTNVGAHLNQTGVVFTATGTTPTVWVSGSTLSKEGIPIPTILENTLGPADADIAPKNAGILRIGSTYKITAYVAGDDFQNCGAMANVTDEIFVCTWTTPTVWINASTLVEQIPTPTPYFIYTAIGDYNMCHYGKFTINKTSIKFGAMVSNASIAIGYPVFNIDNTSMTSDDFDILVYAGGAFGDDIFENTEINIVVYS